MNNLIIYSLEAAISLALFYVAYWLFLKNETFFKLNRIYLLSSVMISLLLPLIQISISGDSFLTRQLIAPIVQYEQELVGKSVATENETVKSAREIAGRKAAAGKNASVAELAAERASLANPQENGNSGTTINWFIIVLAVYFTGAALFLLRFVTNLVFILVYVLKHKSHKISGVRVIRSEMKSSPCSFLNTVFIDQKEYPDDELSKIISHEKVHIRQKHSVDLILLELLLVFQWFNPFVWFYKRAIKITHEYLADQGTLNSGVDLPDYQYSLLNQVLAANNFKMASSYNLSVKKRIAMMMQKRSSKLSVAKLVFTLPILLFLFLAFAFNPAPSGSSKANRLVTDADTSIKEVNVPLEYLKLLEGEYVATNEPNRKRRIIFTEVLGHLYGLDGDYAYKIIPVGGERFINPDDKASLVFDSKDKSAISLLLFGKIHLKKLYFVKGEANVQNRSLGFTLANVMLKRGVQAGLSYYKIAKDSSNYHQSEFEMNWAGYLLLQAGKLEESAAIFKLNTQIYPEAWNTYDSYAESLLEMGDKAQAIENYKKSVQLNPGSRSGISHLKALGVNTDSLIKKVPLSPEYLKLLEGDYLSTNERNWVRWIRFVAENDTLFGNDNGYHYKLIPVGDGKFINPDDGASLVFNTKNKKAVTLSLFGRINLEKVKTVKESAVDLKKYAGRYLPPKEDSILQPMEILHRDGKLFREIPSDPPGRNRTVELQLVTDNIFFYTDRSARSLEFIVNANKEVTACMLRRPDGVTKLVKQK